MQSAPIRRARLPALLALGLLTLAAPGAGARKPAPTGTLVGTVSWAADAAPVAYAVVVDTMSHRGSTTDRRGRFRITGLPAGRLDLRIRALGAPPLADTVHLAPGDTVRRAYRIPGSSRWNYLQVRDSLTALGRWPPTLDPELDLHMREALDVRVFRLDPDHPEPEAPANRERRVGPWPILAEVDPPARTDVAALLETLRRPELYRADVEGAVKRCSGFSPDLDVRFTNTGVPVDVLLCYACGEFAIWSDGHEV